MRTHPMFRKASTTALVSALAVLAGACASTPPAPMALGPTPTENYPLQARTVPEEIALAPHPEGLSDNQRAALARYAQDWSVDGGGPITVFAPQAGGEGAKRVAWATKALFEQIGVAPGVVRVASYDAAAGAPVRVAYDRWAAVVPQCGRSWENLSRTGSNAVQSNFGCATSANMAAQIENPRDIAGARPLDPADVARRENVLGKYRNGEVTSTKSDTQGAGRVSTAVQ